MNSNKFFNEYERPAVEALHSRPFCYVTLPDSSAEHTPDNGAQRQRFRQKMMRPRLFLIII